MEVQKRRKKAHFLRILSQCPKAQKKTTQLQIILADWISKKQDRQAKFTCHPPKPKRDSCNLKLQAGQIKKNNSAGAVPEIVKFNSLT